MVVLRRSSCLPETRRLTVNSLSAYSWPDGRSLRVDLVLWPGYSDRGWHCTPKSLSFDTNSIRCVVNRQKRVAVGDFDGLVFVGSIVGGSQSAGCVEDSLARERYPRRFPCVLALEITTARPPAQDRCGHSCAHSRYERRQSSMGSTTNS
jgi:hypothetical protein